MQITYTIIDNTGTDTDYFDLSELDIPIRRMDDVKNGVSKTRREILHLLLNNWFDSIEESDKFVYPIFRLST